MTGRQLAISVEGLTKDFRLATEQRHTLKERVLNPRFDRDARVFHALRDVSFEVERGEFFGIVGRNGSGKSTLLKCMAGIYRADHGSIRIGGRLSTFIELGVGFNPDLAARDNIILNGIMLGLSPKEAAARVDEVVEFAELEEHMDLKLKNYSSGMQVRLAFSVMTQIEADVLLIDEVLAVGDASFQAKCFDVFRRLREEGRTIVLVTHDMPTVARFCDRAMLVEDGEILAIGEPEEIGDQYLALNFTDHRHDSEPQSPAEEVDDPDRPPVTVAGVVLIDGDNNEIQHVRVGDPLVIALDLISHERTSAPAVMLELRDENNTVVFASTLENLKTDRPTLQAGERWRMTTWVQVNVRPGRLRVRAVVGDDQSQRIYQRTGDLASFEVTSVEPVHGVAALPHEVSWTHVPAATTAS